MREDMLIRKLELPWGFFQRVAHEIQIKEYPAVCYSSRPMKRRIKKQLFTIWDRIIDVDFTRPAVTTKPLSSSDM
jgi:hypothetical protein